MRAILSVSDKRGLIEFARELRARAVELVSTGRTAKALQDEDVDVISVSDVTGLPEMMDGRVKTLHPAIHAGILARRHRQDDLEALARHGVRPIDLVVVNLYPFEAAARSDVDVDHLVEEIDIGGPTLLRAAAKNARDVLVVVDPADYPRVVAELDRDGGWRPAFRLELMRKAFQHTARYDATIAAALELVEVADGTLRRRPLPAADRRRRALRYGENPHQRAWWEPRPEGTRSAWQVHQGKELSFTNLLDLDAAVRLALEFTEPAAVVVKHTNPCGVASGASAADAYVAARDADPLSAFGGIVAVNRPLDVETAAALTSTFIEAVIGPAVVEGAQEVLAKKSNMRVVTADFAALAAPPPDGDADHGDREVRSFFGGLLLQERDRVTEGVYPWPSGDHPKVVTRRAPTADEWTALRFAWRVCAHVKSNAVIFTTADRTLAVGAGQMSRVDAVNVAVSKAAGTLRGAVAASDAFFPFRDGLDAIAAAGATAVVQPGGSVRDAEVVAAADEHGLAMVFTGIRHFRH